MRIPEIRTPRYGFAWGAAVLLLLLSFVLFGWNFGSLSDVPEQTPYIAPGD